MTPSLFQQPADAGPSPPSVEYALRPYQIDALEALDKWLADRPSALVVSPTGTGKTVMFGHLIRRRVRKNRRAMVMVYGETLVQQAAAKMREITGRTVHIERAEDYACRHHAEAVVVASVPTLASGRGDSIRAAQFDPEQFDLVIVDEAHHSVAATYTRPIAHMVSGGAKLVGFTATPNRADEDSLGRVFDGCAFAYGAIDAIRDGWLVSPTCREPIGLEIDFGSIRVTRSGDFNERDLAAAVEAESVVYAMSRAVLELSDERPTLAFCETVAQAQAMTLALNRQRPDQARIIIGTTPREERGPMIDAFAAGEFQYLVNVGVATEGFDCPPVACLAMCRPTKSHALYTQMLGRGLRPLPGVVDQHRVAEDRVAAIAASGKPNCKVIDFVGNTSRHKVLTAVEVLANDYDDDIIAAAREMIDSGRHTMPSEAIEAARAELAEKRRAAEERRAAAAAVVAERTSGGGAVVDFRVVYGLVSADPFDAMQLAPRRETGYDRGRKPTQAMIDFIAARGFDTESLTFGKARAVIDEIKRRDLPTVKLCAMLRRYGLDPAKFNGATARALAAQLARNGWRLQRSWVPADAWRKGGG